MQTVPPKIPTKHPSLTAPTIGSTLTCAHLKGQRELTLNVATREMTKGLLAGELLQNHHQSPGKEERKAMSSIKVRKAVFTH